MSREDDESACLEVGLGPLVSRIPGGLDAKLSERGGGSVGEKQLVSFAMALAQDPRILILDGDLQRQRHLRPALRAAAPGQGSRGLSVC